MLSQKGGGSRGHWRTKSIYESNPLDPEIVKRQDKTSFPNQDETSFPNQDETSFPNQDETSFPNQDETSFSNQDETSFPNQDETSFPNQDEMSLPNQDETSFPNQGESVISKIRLRVPKESPMQTVLYQFMTQRGGTVRRLWGKWANKKIDLFITKDGIVKLPGTNHPKDRAM